MKRICVFCGSSAGSQPEDRSCAEELGAELTRSNIGLVYGGGNVGLMGAIADSVLKAGGEAIGVIPEHLMMREFGHKHLTALHIVKSMHERKALMADLSDSFIALPGGFGTLEEFFEVLAWSQVGLHEKPCGIVQCPRILHPSARGARSRRERTVPETAKSGISPGPRYTFRIAASLGRMAASSRREVARSNYAVRIPCILCGCGFFPV